MFEARRPMGRLFYLLLLALVAAVVSQAQTPATTTISDVVYRADGTPAGGTLLVSWPAFSTANGEAVAAGTKSVTLGPAGALSMELVPTTNATPAGTFYTVVYQLNDGTVKTEYWVVPTTSPTTIVVVRATLGATGSAAQMASRQYVDIAVAAKASDAVVVHKSGSESIAGVKQFSAPPSVPTPAQPADAANKAYVDTAVTNVGSGSFVSKTGDVMTGPLLLPGDPTSPNHASTKHYADIGLAVKANLVGGVVPTSQLGNGTANGTTCLKGDSSWGACGTSSNAVSIQSVPVDTTAPTDNQVITYEASSGKYKPKPGGGVTAGMQAVKYATDFSWSQAPSADLSNAGAKTVSLSACPFGVKGAEPEYYVYIAGTGTAEAVKVTGGTCNGDGQPGTLQFTTANAHPAGYTVQSASDGLQETLIAARFVPTNPAGTSQSGKVIVPPGEFKAYARVSIRAANMTVDFSGSIVECYMNDTCILVGDPANSGSFENITVINPRGRPMVVNGIKPFLEVNAQKTRVFNIATRTAPTGNSFGTYVQVDDDQAFLLDGLDANLGYGIRCDATFCGSYVTAPGPFNTWSAVGWLTHLNISPQCGGNGIDWQSGNTVHVSDSVIQGWSQFGFRGGTKRGGGGGTEFHNVYIEASAACQNPLGNVGQAAIIEQGKVFRGEADPAGIIPQFANTGTTDYRYYIVARNTTFGASNPLYAGKALTSGTGSITVTTPDVAGANTFDLLRVTIPGSGPTGQQAPYGTGNYGVVTNVSRTSACSAGVCTFTDTQVALSTYTVPAVTYFPLLDYWPGGLILSANGDSSSYLGGATAVLDTVAATNNIVSVRGSAAPSVSANICEPASSWTPVWMSCFATTYSPSTFYEQGALLLAVKPNLDGGTKTNLKGRLNFPTLGSGPGHIITLSDSNFQKTVATANNRPTNDANDAYIGYDQGDGSPANIGISFGAPRSLSNYIGNVGDGTNWLERLTASLKEFKTNVQMDGTLTVAGTVQANSFVSTGAGAWNVEGSYGTMGSAAANKSKLGFGVNGKLSVSENAGAVVEVAKKLPQEFTYTFFDPNNPLTMSLQVPSVYVNRATALHIVEVYCEIDAGSATINVQKDDGTTTANILNADLACSTSGAVATGFVSGRDAIAVGNKVDHVTVSTGAGLHRMNVAVKYTVD